ncbi:hypothetical protein DFH11DRAFT_590325 [Phellopilus nigrolimitatus]|nr:hypothetical protein DFH11DRAFT_590325 [Phellopilus nigrolimitatus]
MTSAHEPKPLEERYGEGDTYIVVDVLPADLAGDAFERIQEEVEWNTMSHRGGEVPRLVAVQGEIAEDGSIPVYRHPADASPPLLPFSPTVERIRAHISGVLRQPLNHALIQYYRHGGDYISEHSDKTVDVVRGSCIVNLSLGAQRTMTLRTKKDSGPERLTQRIPLPHNSALVMGLATNAAWLHSVRRDQRIPTVKAPAEAAFDGARISLTFRHIGTFLSANLAHIWGQGATGKTRTDASEVTRSIEEVECLLAAFGKENHNSNFDWEATYGQGFNVLHFT